MSSQGNIIVYISDFYYNTIISKLLPYWWLSLLGQNLHFKINVNIPAITHCVYYSMTTKFDWKFKSYKTKMWQNMCNTTYLWSTVSCFFKTITIKSASSMPNVKLWKESESEYVRFCPNISKFKSVIVPFVLYLK